MAGRRLLDASVMTLVALVVAHNLTFLLAYGAGYGEALAHSGHGGAWSTAVEVVLAAGLTLFGLAVWRLHRLGVIARGLTFGDEVAGRRLFGGFGRSLSTLWLRLAIATAVLLVLQENVEHWFAGEVPPGIAVLGSPEYPNALIVVIAVTFAVAIVGALFRWRRDILTARIALGHRQRRRRYGALELGRVPVIRDRRPESMVGRGLAVRAPPLRPVT